MQTIVRNGTNISLYYLTDNKTVDITFSTQIGGPNDELNGIFMSGSNGTNKVFV